MEHNVDEKALRRRVELVKTRGTLANLLRYLWMFLRANEQAG
jgi:hypothetical protein